MPKLKKIQPEKCISAKGNAKHSENQELTFLLNKFRKDDILTSIIESPGDVTRKSKKNNVIKEAINFLTEKFSDLDELILYLQLKYIQTQKKERYWNILEIKDAKRFKKPDLSSAKVSSSMLKYFSKYDISCKIFSEKMNDCIWTAVFFIDDKCLKTPTFFLAHMRLSVVFYHNLKSKYSLIAEKVLRKTYRGTDIKQLTNIYNYGEYLQQLNIKTYRSLCKNYFSPKKNKNIKVLDDLKSNKATKKVKYQNVPSCVLTNTSAIQGKKRSEVDSGLQSDYVHTNSRDKIDTSNSKRDAVADNITDKTTILDGIQSNHCDVIEKTRTPNDNQSEFVTEKVKGQHIILNKLQGSLVTHNVTKKNKTLNDLQSDCTTKNVKDKTIVLNKLQSCLETDGVPEKIKTSNHLQNDFVTKHIRDKTFILDKSQSSFVTCDVREKAKTPNNLHSSSVAQTIKGKTNILDDLERSIVTEDIKDKTTVPKDLQRGFEIQNYIKTKSSDDLQKDFQVIRNATEITDDFEHDSAYAREDLPSIVNENKRELRRKRKYVKKTFKGDVEPPAKNLKYIVKSDSFGTWENTNACCVITFQGTNILKGFGKLVNSGMADAPLPDYLCKEPKTGKNTFVLTV